jgi:putative FmdB family regulatory protein
LPLYEYRCQKCGTRIEKIQKFSDAALKRCEKCGGKLERLVSAPSIQFKGTGWYVTDYPRKSSGSDGDDSKPAKPASENAPKETQAKTETKDTKPAAKK